MTRKPRARAIDLMLQRIRQTAADPSPAFPHYGDPQTGAWTRSENGDWTGGFWVGELWLAAAATGDDQLRARASEWSERILPRASSDTIFRGFLFWYGAAIGARLFDDDAAAAIAETGAAGLLQMYDEKAGLLPLGTTAEEAQSVGHFDTNIDGVPGVVPLLAWTGRRSGATARIDMARSHARQHEAFCVRDDDSVCQSASFDPADGSLVRRYTHKGVTDESTWTRAQAWAMLGYAQSVHWLGKEFLDVACRVADWWIAHLPDDDITWWDFDAPGTIRDTSGTAIAAAAMLKLAAAPGVEDDRYRAAAERMIDALIDRHLTGMNPGDLRPPGILADGCYNQRIELATANELIWGDYMLLEALLCIEDRTPIRSEEL